MPNLPSRSHCGTGCVLSEAQSGVYGLPNVPEPAGTMYSWSAAGTQVFPISRTDNGNRELATLIRVPKAFMVCILCSLPNAIIMARLDALRWGRNPPPDLWAASPAAPDRASPACRDWAEPYSPGLWAMSRGVSSRRPVTRLSFQPPMSTAEMTADRRSGTKNTLLRNRQRA